MSVLSSICPKFCILLSYRVEFQQLLGHHMTELTIFGMIADYRSYAKWRLLLSINLISSTKEVNPIMTKSNVKLSNAAKVRSCSPKTHEWQTFEKPGNKRQIVWHSQSTQAAN